MQLRFWISQETVVFLPCEESSLLKTAYTTYFELLQISRLTFDGPIETDKISVEVQSLICNRLNQTSLAEVGKLLTAYAQKVNIIFDKYFSDDSNII